MKNCSSYFNNSEKIETLSIFSLIVPVICVILNGGNSPTQTLQADLLLAGLRKEGRQVTPQMRCKCHLSCFYYYFQKEKIISLGGYYEYFAQYSFLYYKKRKLGIFSLM